MRGYDSPQAMAESLLAMSPAAMERALAALFQAQTLPAETLARLHGMQLRRAVRETQA